MKNSANKKFTALILTLCLLVVSTYAACMACDISPFTGEVSLEDTCASKGFNSGAESDDCCKKNSCTDPKTDVKALATRVAKTKAPVLAAAVTAPYSTAPQGRFASLTRADYKAYYPPDRTYLQHCSFLC